MTSVLLLALVTAPLQPAAGPGGADYRHAKVVESDFGRGGAQCWIFEPASPAPTSAPVVVFLHGWGAMYPRSYDRWIEHIARRGNIVIYPRYQTNLATLPKQFSSNAVVAIQSAVRVLQSGNHVRPDLDRVAVVGHSMGGAIAANLAAEPSLHIRAVMSVEPGDGTTRNAHIQFPKADWSKIPASTLLLAVVGDEDRVARDVYAKLIFGGTPQIPVENKDCIIVRSDRHGSPALVANHQSPLATSFWRRSVNALDYYGYWKLFDALTDAAFYGKNREFALGNTPQQRFMGRWSDGVPVKELVVTDDP
jgi:dienelactone hydrolase